MNDIFEYRQVLQVQMIIMEHVQFMNNKFSRVSFNIYVRAVIPL